jgi:hypothetical protein
MRVIPVKTEILTKHIILHLEPCPHPHPDPPPEGEETAMFLPLQGGGQEGDGYLSECPLCPAPPFMGKDEFPKGRSPAPGGIDKRG